MNAFIKRSLIIVPTIALAGLVATGMAMAGNQGDHGGWGKMGGNRSDMMVGRMSTALNLTDAQESAVKDIMKGQHKGQSGGHQAMAVQFSELGQLESGSDAYIAKAKSIGALQGEAMGRRLIERANVEMQIVDLLTPEQVEQYQQMRNNMADKRAEHMGNLGKKGNHSS